MKHLIKDFKINLDTIKAFNTKGVLSDLSYLQESNTTGGMRRKSRKMYGMKGRKSRKMYRVMGK
jgi:hypothetical protein